MSRFTSAAAARLRWMACAVALCSTAASAERTPMHPGALAHALDRVAHTGRVLYVAAHPDDENTRLLAYLANARHLTVAYLSMTRGGGGQNLIGSEQGSLLDVIRTQELLAARDIDGAIQRFTRMRDFGYSKTAQEALAQWGHPEALADVVWTIRTFQPDVVITRFNEDPPNHGHHTASALLAREAITAAADPKRFPEQLQRGARPWKVARLMHNVSPWRQKPPPDALALDVGGYDVRMGRSYGEVAAESRSQHKSQGFGVAGERGALLEHFVHLEGSRPKSDLLEGIDVSWLRFGAVAKPFVQAVDEARKQLRRDEPEAALPSLVKAHAALAALPEGPRREDARVLLEQVIAGASGLFVRATSKVAAVAPGGKLPVTVEVVVRRPAPVKVERITFPDGEVMRVGQAPALNEKKEWSRDVQVREDAEISTPYWLKTRPSQGRHEVSDPLLVGAPEGPSPLRALVRLQVAGRAIDVDAPVQHVWTDRVHGERARRVLIVPPATVTPLRDAVMLPNGRAAPVALRVHGHEDNLSLKVRLPLPDGWKATPQEHDVKLAKAGEETLVRFEVRAPKGAQPVTASPQAVVGGRAFAFSEDVIDYPHIPMQVVLQPAQVRLSPLSLRHTKGLVGYVVGSGDTIPEDLSHVGVRVQTLDDEALRAGDLKKYSAIVLGIRALNTREVLQAVHPRLMRYVEQGGTLVVQYNTNSPFSPLDAKVGPFPLTIGRGRVTDETAQMFAVNPKAAVLTTPNRLTEQDYEGWVQERGLYFAEKWDERYTPIFRVADPNEAPQEGSVLVAHHGKGRFVYTGLSFFRQLPAGVPGAYRLFANLLEAK